MIAQVLSFPAAILFAFPLLSAATDPDLVVVGLGTAGCALIGRLCRALPDATFVALERGLPRNSTEEFYVRSLRLAVNTWQLPSLTETVLSTDAKPQLFLTGNTLGGTSSINAAQFTVPRLGTAGKWGVEGITEEVEREMRRRVAEKIGGRPLVEELQDQKRDFFLDAAKDVGFEVLGDDDELLAKDGETREAAIGNSRFAGNAESGSRRDSFTAYLKDAIAGECAGRVHIEMGANVGKIVVEEGRASGVEYIAADGHKRTLQAKREVIVAAGPFHTPKLLQLSGIGPRELLESKGVEVKAELPVGMAAQSRSYVPLVYTYSGVPLADADNNTKLLHPAEKARFMRGEKSLYGQSPGPILGFAGRLGYFGVASLSPFNASDPAGNAPSIVLFCAQNPRSRSTVSIHDTDPASSPDVFLNTVATDEEAEEILACLRKISPIGDSFAPELGTVNILPGAVDLSKTWVRNSALNFMHFVGGASVGEVLDERLRVKGVRDLRVVDASAIPEMPLSSGPLTSVYLLAEIAAEIIEADYGVSNC